MGFNNLFPSRIQDFVGGGGQLLRPKVADVARQICVNSETFVVGAQDPLADFLMLKCACITESCYSDYFPPYLAKRRQIRHAVLWDVIIEII